MEKMGKEQSQQAVEVGIGVSGGASFGRKSEDYAEPNYDRNNICGETA